MSEVDRRRRFLRRLVGETEVATILRVLVCVLILGDMALTLSEAISGFAMPTADLYLQPVKWALQAVAVFAPRTAAISALLGQVVL